MREEIEKWKRLVEEMPSKLSGPESSVFTSKLSR